MVGVERTAAGGAVGIAWIADGRPGKRLTAAGCRIDTGGCNRGSVAIARHKLKRRRHGQLVVLVVEQQRGDVWIIVRVYSRTDAAREDRKGQIRGRRVEQRKRRRPPIR